jgi:hypothetical protein
MMTVVIIVIAVIGVLFIVGKIFEAAHKKAMRDFDNQIKRDIQNGIEKHLGIPKDVQDLFVEGKNLWDQIKR